MLHHLSLLPAWLSRLLLILMLCLTPVAHAKDISGGGSTCATLTNTTANPAAGGNRVNLETFVPDPICWLTETQAQANKAELYAWAKNIAIGLIVLAGGLAAFSMPANPAGAWTKLVIAGLCMGMVTGGGATTITTMLNEGWNSAYSGGATIGQSMLNANTLQDARDLGSKFEQYLKSTAHLKVVEKAMKTTALLSNSNTDSLTQAYNVIVEKSDLNGSTEGSNPIWGGFAGITYFLILGLFTVFAIMIYSSGFLILVIGILMPIIIATCAFGNFTPLLGVGKLGLGAILSVALLPIVVGLTTGTMLRSPMQTLSASMDASIELTEKRIVDYKTVVDGCKRMSMGDCFDAVQQYGTFQTDVGGAIQDAIIGLGLGVFAVLAAFAVAMTQLRRVPALIFQVLGAAGGGGESSGAYIPPGPSDVARAGTKVVTTVVKKG